MTILRPIYLNKMALSIPCNWHLELTKTNQHQYHWPYHYFYQYHFHHLYQQHYHYNYPVFSLNFTSAGKGPVLASKAKNMHQRHTLLGRGGGGGKGCSGVRDMASPSLGNFGAKFLQTSFPHIKIYLMQICHCYLKRTKND